MPAPDKRAAHGAVPGRLLFSLLAITAVAPAYAIMNGEGQDIFPVPAVFQASAAITYSNAANAGLTVSSGLIVNNGNVGIGTTGPENRKWGQPPFMMPMCEALPYSRAMSRKEKAGAFYSSL